MEKVKLAEVLRGYRITAMRTQAQLGKALGVKLRTVWRWENGYKPALKNRRKLVRMLQIDPAYIDWGFHDWDDRVGE